MDTTKSLLQEINKLPYINPSIDTDQSITFESLISQLQDNFDFKKWYTDNIEKIKSNYSKKT